MKGIYIRFFILGLIFGLHSRMIRGKHGCVVFFWPRSIVLIPPLNNEDHTVINVYSIVPPCYTKPTNIRDRVAGVWF